MYDEYDYSEIDVSDDKFLKLKTTLFLEPDFILGNSIQFPRTTQGLLVVHVHHSFCQLNFLCSLIDCFDMSDIDKRSFLEEILQYWILSVKDSK